MLQWVTPIPLLQVGSFPCLTPVRLCREPHVSSRLVLSPFGRLVPTPNTAYSAMDAGAYEPWIPDFDGNSRWRWEWWKVGLQPEALFTTLEAQYNTVPYRIQDDEAFHHDVSDAAHEAKNVDDFHARLARRRDERLQELRTAWTRVSLSLLYSKAMLDDPPTRWGAFQHFTSNRSLDSIVNFFHSLLPPETPTAPQLRGAQLPRSPPVEANQTEELLPDTAPASPSLQASPLPKDPPDSAPMAPQLSPPPPRPPRRTTRHSSSLTPLTRHAGVGKRRQRASQRSNGVQKPSPSQRKPPARQGKAQAQEPATQTRGSRRLAGHPPEFREGVKQGR